MKDQQALFDSLTGTEKARFEKARIGRPSAYDESMCDIVIAMYAKGSSKHQVCAELGICSSTYDYWRRDPKKVHFLAAHNKGQTLARAKWDDHVDDNLGNRTFNFYMHEANYKRRFNCAEDSTVNITGFEADASFEKNIKAVMASVAKEEISPSQGSEVMSMMSKGYGMAELEKVKDDLEAMKEREKERNG